MRRLGVLTALPLLVMGCSVGRSAAPPPTSKSGEHPSTGGTETGPSLEGDAYALIICSGLGSGPRIDPAEIRDPLVLLISHRWFSLRTRAMAVELESMKRDRAVVSAMLRHDLRHPIQAITAAAEMVSSAEFELSEEEKVELLDLIVTEANRLNRMLDEAFDDAVGGENVPPKMRWTEVTEVVGKVADTARRRRAGRIEVSVDPQSIRTDPDLLGRALLNLVDNAQKHAPTGTAVQIRGESRGSSYALAVVDAGEGVDPSLVPYLFTPFSNDSERADSTGLGLVSAARVMERLGGRVLYSRVSGTTVFELVLPVDDEATAPGVGSAA